MIALLLTMLAHAHLPNVATYSLTPGEDAWELEVALPTDGMHVAMKREYPGVPLSSLTPEAYSDKLSHALVEHITLSVDGDPLVLGPGRVELAPHATHVWFRIEAPPGRGKAIEARLDPLGDIKNQHNVFRFLGEGQAARVVLSASNGFRGRVAVSGRR